MCFKKLSLQDISVVKPFFEYVDSRTCDFSTGGMFMWREYYDMEYMIDDGILFSRLKDENGDIYYNIPMSDNIEQAININISKWRKKGEKIKFCTVPESCLPYFTKIAPDAEITEYSDFFDYLYDASELKALKGRKYHNQRNLISQFVRNNANWRFVNIDSVSIDGVICFFKKFCEYQADDTKFANEENRMVLEVLRNMEQYRLLGGVLLSDNKIIGFSLGEIIKDTLFVHVEKADKNYVGAYQMLSREFTVNFGGDVSYVNKEEDMGDSGLRGAKKAYNPISLLKKYIVTVN